MDRGTAPDSMTENIPDRCWVDVDLDALSENVRSIRRHLSGEMRYISVVKADAYGLGARQAVPAFTRGGAEIFAVANLAEAAELREVAPEAPVLLLSATTPDEEEFLWDLRVIPTLSTPEEVVRLEAIAARRGAPLTVHLKVDTGMGRLGIWHTEWARFESALQSANFLRIEGIYSHFANAGDDPAFTAEQRKRFLEICRSSPLLRERTDLLVHIDNSSGLGSFVPGTPWNAVRVGLLQYGILPCRQPSLARAGIVPAASWHSRVTVIKDLPAGVPVSYSGTHTLRRPSRVAIVAAGYADGIPRSCSNRLHLLIRGRRCAVLGNVTMDELIVDVSDAPDAARGDTATIVGRQGNQEISWSEFSSSAGTIPWESLCAISKRVRRRYGEIADRLEMIDARS